MPSFKMVFGKNEKKTQSCKINKAIEEIQNKEELYKKKRDLLENKIEEEEKLKNETNHKSKFYVREQNQNVLFLVNL
jgi:ribosomal protein L3